MIYLSKRRSTYSSNMDATFGDEPTCFGFITIFRCTKMLNFTVGAYISSTGFVGVLFTNEPCSLKGSSSKSDASCCWSFWVWGLWNTLCVLPPSDRFTVYTFPQKDTHQKTTIIPPPKKKKTTTPPQQQIGEKRLKKKHHNNKAHTQPPGVHLLRSATSSAEVGI